MCYFLICVLWSTVIGALGVPCDQIPASVKEHTIDYVDCDAASKPSHVAAWVSLPLKYRACLRGLQEETEVIKGVCDEQTDLDFD